jgi:hypothetical protein
MGESVRDSDAILSFERHQLSVRKIKWHTEIQSHITHKAIQLKVLITLSVIALQAILMQLDIRNISSCMIL